MFSNPIQEFEQYVVNNNESASIVETQTENKNVLSSDARVEVIDPWDKFFDSLEGKQAAVNGVDISPKQVFNENNENDMHCGKNLIDVESPILQSNTDLIVFTDVPILDETVPYDLAEQLPTPLAPLQNKKQYKRAVPDLIRFSDMKKAGDDKKCDNKRTSLTAKFILNALDGYENTSNAENMICSESISNAARTLDIGFDTSDESFGHLEYSDSE